MADIVAEFGHQLMLTPDGFADLRHHISQQFHQIKRLFLFQHPALRLVVACGSKPQTIENCKSTLKGA